MNDQERLRLLRNAIDRLEKTGQGFVQAQKAINTHGHWKAAMQILRALEEDLAPAPPPPPPPPPKVPALGPVFAGDKSLLQCSPTHDTSGLGLYSAFDSGWKKGLLVLAPEAMTVTRHSGTASGGFSVYATGVSGLLYYFQHMESAGRAPVGRAVAKGGKIGVLGDFVGARVPHLHLGINIEALAGKGKQLKFGKTGTGPSYTVGSPDIGAQLAQLD
jgi:hypothetical protein